MNNRADIQMVLVQISICNAYFAPDSMIAAQRYGHHRFCSLRSSLTAKIILYNLCDRIRFSLWKKHGLLYRIMRSNHLFHPDHIIPTAKFITTMTKSSYRLKSKMSMELLTVFCQIFIFLLRIADTGAVSYTHLRKHPKPEPSFSATWMMRMTRR